MRKRMGRRVREEEMTKEETRQLWDTAQPVEVERRRRESSVLSVRLPFHVFDDLVREAYLRGKGPATLARELIEEGLARGEDAPLVLLALRLAQRLQEPVREAPLVRFSKTPPGLVIQPGECMLWRPNLDAVSLGEAIPLGERAVVGAEAVGLKRSAHWRPNFNLWVIWRPALAAALLDRPSTKSAEEHTKVEVRMA